METTKEFTGDTLPLVLGILFCLPFGLYYFFANREERVICPECRESADPDANTCPHCGESF